LHPAQLREKSPKQIETPDVPEVQELPSINEIEILVPAKQEIPVRLPFLPIKNIGFALLAALSGEIIYTVFALRPRI